MSAWSGQAGNLATPFIFDRGLGGGMLPYTLRNQPTPGAKHTLPPFGADGESIPITALAMPIRVLCAPPADHGRDH